MIINTEKINDPNLSEEENDLILKSFVRRFEKERNIDHWEKVLTEEYDLPRPLSLPPRSAKVRKLFLPIIGIAAAILMLIVFLPGLLRTNGQELLADYQEAALVTGYRSQAASQTASLRESLIADFFDGDYAAAQEAGKALREQPDTQPRDVMNLGISALRNQNYSEATNAFRELLASDEALQTEARYYLGLSLLLQENTQEGFTELRKINAADGTKFYDKAQDLLGANWK